MSEKQNNPAPQDNNEQAMRLDDESRVKVLSPSMLVFKRFVRNRLAIVGLVILIVMFLFSFLGGWISPYSQSQVFYKYDTMPKDYASIVVNNELRYTVADGEDFSLGARAQFILALNNDQPSFASDGNTYSYIAEDADSYRIVQNTELGTALALKGKYIYTESEDGSLPADVTAAFEAARAGDEDFFELDGATYTIIQSGKSVAINRSSDVALASMRMFDAYDQGDSATVNSYAFRMAVEETIAAEGSNFDVDGVAYTLDMGEGAITVYKDDGGNYEPFAIVSDLIASAISPDIYITVPFKDAMLDAIDAGETTFLYPDEDGADVEYSITRLNNTYTVKRDVTTQLYDMYAYPSREHPLGTDGNGMDMLTRLMYGGRISLMVGFVVVLIEVVIGVVIGGVAGYFGGWIDTLLMRFIDLFNCIPYYPIMIIVGAVMDTLDVDPTVRIFLLMLILGLLGWTNIARIVRGQILSLREQDFMVATEATGLRVSRRIFRHLVPNVMPLLIVQATMSLGGIIITEATLSFLGLGLKYPMASWGTIINAATNIFVMQNYWFIWIPAGLLILLTVLGFNFVGDGLRDAFDPKMKR